MKGGKKGCGHKSGCNCGKGGKKPSSGLVPPPGMFK